MESRLTLRIACFLVCVFRTFSATGEDASPVSLAPVEVSSEAVATGEELMERVVRQISQHQSVSAQIRHRVHLFGQKLVGSGVYLQRRAEQGVQVRFSLSVQSDERMVSLLHVCDGRFLWMHDNVGATPSLVRVDLLRVRSAIGDGDAGMPILLGGGLPQLLGSLRRNFVFSQPQPIVFQGVPVWAVACQWNPQELARSVGRPDLVDEKGTLKANSLPDQMPDQVFLLVGRDDLFPYHIDFRRSFGDDEPGKANKGRSSSRSLVTMELFEVQFNGELDPILFVYKPGNNEVDDQTDEFVTRARAESRRP
jgi:hypothetical protein